MAWFGEGLSSLRGQISNFAKGVLVDEDENTNAASSEKTVGPATTSESNVENFGWSEAEEATFIGQDADNGNGNEDGDSKPEQATPAVPTTSGSGAVDNDVAAIIPKGVAQFFHNIGGAVLPTDLKRGGRSDQECQTDFPLSNSAPPYFELTLRQLREENSQLSSEITLLRRMVRELENQIASTQDENSNLSTGLEALDIQHQEAIQRILVIKEETQKELEQVKKELSERNEAYSCLLENNDRIKKELELANLELMGCDTLSQENAHLREKISDLMTKELPAISEQSAAEEHVRTLEVEVAALRESRDNLERETATLLSQIHQRDASLREVDARLEEITKEKEVKERNMTQIVFECNSLREELKACADKIVELEETVSSMNSEKSCLNEKLGSAMEEVVELKSSLETARRERMLAKDESEMLKSELESLKEELGGEEAKVLRDSKDLLLIRQQLDQATANIQSLEEKLASTEKLLGEAVDEKKSMKLSWESEQQELLEELNMLRDTRRDYSIQKDIFKEKEAELKRQLGNSEAELSNARSQLEQADKDLRDIKLQLESTCKENQTLSSKVASLSEESKELSRYKRQNEDLTLEIENVWAEIRKRSSQIDDLIVKNRKLEEECKGKPSLDLLQSEIDNYQKVIKLLNAKISSYEEGPLKGGGDVDASVVMNERKRFASEKAALTEQINSLKEEVVKLSNEKTHLQDKINSLNKSFEPTDGTEKLVDISLSSEVIENNKGEAVANSKELKELIDKNKFLEDVIAQQIAMFAEYNGTEGALQRLAEQREELTSLHQQIDHLKDDLSETYDEKSRLSHQCSLLEKEKVELIQQTEILRKELDNILTLKEELGNAKHSLQIKVAEAASFESEIKRLNNALSVQLSKNDSLYKEKNELLHKLEKLHVEMQNKMANMEEIEKGKTKEIEMLKQEVENMKTQLEYASQLLQDVERQDGEGQPSGESQSQKMSSEVEEEMTRLTAALLKEQTDCKLLKNQLEETKEKLEKAENQLRTLKGHLVEIQDSYSSELSAAEEKLRESQTQLMAAEERARNSSTAYTSASIRANQQVETLREQLRLVSEQKEKLEQQLSQAEDAAFKQSAAVTRLQAVLHQFHIDKQKDIDFETERIRRDLHASEMKNEELQSQLKILEEELNEARKGLAAGQKLGDELLKQSEIINELKNDIFELKEKLRMKEEKMSDLNSENKVDRTLVKNLLVGYVTSTVDSKGKVLGVLAQVLSLTKEERQKVGLEPGGRQQSLSEAFIKFLQSESQPRPEVILPLQVPSEQPPSRKSSLLTPEVPVLPHFPVGRNPGSILKDVLQERRPQ